MYLQTEWDQRIKIWLEELEREIPRTMDKEAIVGKWHKEQPWESLEWFDNCYDVRSE